MRNPHPLLVCLVLIAGCIPSSPPTEFFTLGASGDDRRPVQVEGPEGPPLAVNSVVLPPELDRPQLVRYREGGRVEVMETRRWAAPLQDLVLRAIALDLSTLLPAVVLPGQPKPEEPARSLDVVIERFGAEPADRLALRAHWTLTSPDGHILQRRTSGMFIPMSSGSAEDIVAAMSRALSRLSREVAAAATSTR